MKLNIQIPNMVAEARHQAYRKKMHPALDLLIQIAIFVAVFLVVMIFEGILGALFMIPAMLLDGSFVQQLSLSVQSGGAAATSGDVMEMANSIMQSPLVMIATLFATAGAFVVVIFYCRVIEKRNVATLGFRRGNAVREYLVGLGIGALMFAAVVGIGVVSGSLTYAGLAGGSLVLIVLLLIAFMVQSMSEELLCRGYFLVSIANRQNLAVAIIVSSCVFGLLHIVNPGVTFLAILNIVLFGIFAGIYMLKRGNLWGIGAIHATWNFTQGSVFGIHVSGLNVTESVFSFIPAGNLTLINGGSFGMEAGLAASIVLVAAIVIALFMKTKDQALAPITETSKLSES